MRKIIVNRNDSGQRLDRFLGKAVPLLPESLLQKYIRKKRVKVDGKAVKGDTRISESDVIELYINDEFFQKPSEENAYLTITSPKVRIVYEDENILLADKEAGVLCHSDSGWDADTLITNIKAYLYLNGEWNPNEENSFAPALANRIDRNTGGIVIAAKNAEALRILNEKIRNREIKKFYFAAVHGSMTPGNGQIKSYLFKDAKNNRVYVKRTPEKGTRSAVTRYRTLAEKNGASLLECELVTGRTHQIRAQMSAVGHPLLGDGKYGRDDGIRSLSLPGQALYSYRLRFAFKSDSGALEYLKGREFKTPVPAFVRSLFPEYAEKYAEGGSKLK